MTIFVTSLPCGAAASSVWGWPTLLEEVQFTNFVALRGTATDTASTGAAVATGSTDFASPAALRSQFGQSPDSRRVILCGARFQTDVFA